MKTLKSKIDGFSLMELLIALSIISILAGIAYPSYLNFSLKGRRSEGRVALVELMQQQERYMTQNNTYLLFTNNSGVTSPASLPFKSFSGDSAANASYFLASSVCAGTISAKDCVKLVATPKNADPEAGDLELYSTGQKDCSGSKKSVCWN